MKRTELKRSTPLRSTGKPKATKRRQKTANLKAKDRATVLHSQYVRLRDGRCVRCGRSGEDANLQCAHIVSRRCAATRTDEANAATLCGGCHMRLTDFPHEHVAFFTAYLGSWDAYQALIDKAEAGLHRTLREPFWLAEIERLAGLLEEQERHP